MFGFGRRREKTKARAAFREEFESTITSLESAPEHVRIAVAVGLNLAHSLFTKTHKDVEHFRAVAPGNRAKYIEQLTTAEQAFYDREDPATALGFGLLKMWLGTVQAADSELERIFAAKLAWLSKLAPDDGSSAPVDMPSETKTPATLRVEGEEWGMVLPTKEWANALALALKFGWNPTGSTMAFMAFPLAVGREESAALNQAWQAALDAALKSPMTFYPVRMDMPKLAEVTELSAQGAFHVYEG